MIASLEVQRMGLIDREKKSKGIFIAVALTTTLVFSLTFVQYKKEGVCGGNRHSRVVQMYEKRI